MQFSTVTVLAFMAVLSSATPSPLVPVAVPFTVDEAGQLVSRTADAALLEQRAESCSPVSAAIYNYSGLCGTSASCGYSGYTVRGFCSGGSTNICCVRSRCTGKYSAYSCADSTKSVCNHGTFRTGFCPGPGSYQCCAP